MGSPSATRWGWRIEVRNSTAAASTLPFPSLPRTSHHAPSTRCADLKPENILIGKPAEDGTYQIKVADFGLSTLMKADEMLSTACGSPHYVAPEILTFDGGAAYDGLLSDVWSLGVLLHVMLCYKLPFEAESTQLLYKKIRQGLLPEALPQSLTPAATSLLHGMLTVEPSKRMTLVQVAQHEWPQLPASQAPLLMSQTVDAAVDTYTQRDGSETCTHHPAAPHPIPFSTPSQPLTLTPPSPSTVLSASNLFALGSEPSSSDVLGGGSRRTGNGPLRRAFTFDHLPSPDDECADLLLFEPPPSSRIGDGPQTTRSGSRSRGSSSLRTSPLHSPLHSPLRSPREPMALLSLSPQRLASASTRHSRATGGVRRLPSPRDGDYSSLNASGQESCEEHSDREHGGGNSSVEEGHSSIHSDVEANDNGVWSITTRRQQRPAVDRVAEEQIGSGGGSWGGGEGGSGGVAAEKAAAVANRVEVEAA